MKRLQDRVQKRIDSIGKSPITLARSVGLERGYINDILIGRKKSVRDSKLGLVAQALECDPEYLLGLQDTIRKQVAPQLPPRATVQSPGLAVHGVCQSGIWRSQTAPPDFPPTLPVAPDVRYANLPQAAYLIRPEEVNSVTLVLTVEFSTFESSIQPIGDGAFVVVRREQGTLAETSLRVARFPKRELHPIDNDPAAEIIKGTVNGWPSDVRALAVATSVIKLKF